jgi:dihydroorotate dehydrogenase electron transfer subunit
MAPFLQRTAEVIDNFTLARETWCIRIREHDIARAIRPGQFVMLRLLGRNDPLLGRPYALYDTVLNSNGEPVGLDIVYLVVGKQTKALTQLCPGDKIDIWAPLGNGFPELQGVDRVCLVAGGIGQTPFLAYIRLLLGQRGYGGDVPRRRAQGVTVFYGVRNSSFFAGLDDFRAAGAQIHLATDDGTAGHHGFVTQLLPLHPPPDHIVACGPGPMMDAVAEFARNAHVPCHLSLETPMACGVGICFSCVTRVKDGEGWDYRRVCIDGPVFDATILHRSV